MSQPGLGLSLSPQPSLDILGCVWPCFPTQAWSWSHPQADNTVQVWPIPIPREVPDAHDWGCPWLPLRLPCSPAGVVGQAWLVRPYLATSGELLKLPAASPRKLMAPAVQWCVEKILIIPILMRKTRSRVWDDWPRAVLSKTKLVCLPSGVLDVKHVYHT